MNIALFELRAARKSTIIWSLSIVMIYILFMEGIYPIFAGSLGSVEKVLANYPPAFMAAFGFERASLFTYSGFYGFSFMYLSMIAGIMGASLSLASFSREKRLKCEDFLFTKPISRKAIFLAKWMSNFAGMIAMNFIFLVVVEAICIRNHPEEGRDTVFLMALVAIFLTQMVFHGFGVFFAVFAKKIRSVSGSATSIGFIALALSALANISGDENLRLLAPLRYFDPSELFKNGHFDGTLVIVAVMLVVLCNGLSFLKFCSSDRHAV